MPYTEKQRRLFHAKAKTDPKFKALADEADRLPVKRSPKKKKVK